MADPIATSQISQASTAPAVEQTKKGLSASAISSLANVFNQLIKTLGDVAKGVIELKYNDRNISYNAGSFAAADGAARSQAISELDEKLENQIKADADEAKKQEARRLKDQIVTQTGNVGLSTNRAAISTIMADPELFAVAQREGQNVYLNKDGTEAFTQKDLDLALGNEYKDENGNSVVARFSTDPEQMQRGSTETATKDSEGSRETAASKRKTAQESSDTTLTEMDRHSEVRAAQTKILEAAYKNSSAKHPLRQSIHGADGSALAPVLEKSGSGTEAVYYVNADSLAAHVEAQGYANPEQKAHFETLNRDINQLNGFYDRFNNHEAVDTSLKSSPAPKLSPAEKDQLTRGENGSELDVRSVYSQNDVDNGKRFSAAA